MKRAMIIGASGQDGSYLAELLLGKGYGVLGTTRASPASAGRLVGGMDVLTWDLRDERVLERAIQRFKPDELYNLAAFSSGAGMFQSPVDMGDINGLAVARILGAIERCGRPVRFCQASSSEVFGSALTSPQSELTAPYPRTPYGAAKLYAESMVRIYRTSRKVFACNAILYNHESPRRGDAFVTTKVARAAARISLGLQSELELETVDSRRDWGHARDYVEAMWLMLQHDVAEDFVIATGVTHSVEELCDHAFAAVGLSYHSYVKVTGNSSRSAEAAQLVGDAGKARRLLGWRPKTTFSNLIREMVSAEVSNAGSGTNEKQTPS